MLQTFRVVEASLLNNGVRTISFLAFFKPKAPPKIEKPEISKVSQTTDAKSKKQSASQTKNSKNATHDSDDPGLNIMLACALKPEIMHQPDKLIIAAHNPVLATLLPENKTTSSPAFFTPSKGIDHVTSDDNSTPSCGFGGSDSDD